MKPLDKENRACKYHPWRILKESLNDRACRFSRWEWFSVTNSDKQKDCLCFKGQKKDVPCKTLSHQTDKHYFKVIMAATLHCTRWWYCYLSIKKHLRSSLKVIINTSISLNNIYLWKDWIVIQDGALSHTSNLAQDLLKETIYWFYIKKDQQPPLL